MKNIYFSCLMLLLLAGCTEESIETDNEVLNLRTSVVDCLEVDLIAGQNEVAGTVSLAKVGNSVHVTYSTTNDWKITETHLFVGDCGDMPVNNGGNPKVGKFPFKGSHNSVDEYTYIVSLAGLPECLCVAAHAVVENDVTNANETAWGEGTDFPGNSWAMYFDFCQDDCVIPF